MAAGQCANSEDFFRYTSGRWLWEEQARLQERYKRFNIPGLQKIAAASVGAQSCMSMVKLAEGGSNKIFRLVMNEGTVVIARIPHPNAGSLFHTVTSEVATMSFASTILGIPVPRVFDWSAKTENPAQTEYILMEEAAGIPLSSTWDSTDVQAKSDIVDDLVSIAKKLLSISFSRYGNIYFAEDRFPGCETITVQSDLPIALKTEVERRYVIGPVAETSFWDGERREFAGVRGPWATPEDYVKAVTQREIRWLNNYARPKNDVHPQFLSKAQRCPEAHIALYAKLLSAADDLLATHQDLLKSILWHWDMHAPNIFVTDNKITSLIDWQDCWAGPLMLQGWRPKLVDFRGELKFELPPDYQTLEEGDEKQKICSDVEKSILLLSYESQMQRANPALDRIFQLPQGQTIRDMILFAANTWDGGLIPFRECLLRIQRNWGAICPDRPCPFSFTADEISAHLTEGEECNANAEFWSSISEIVGRDGFVMNEDYDKALDMFRALREEGLRVLEGDERAEFEYATRWASTEDSETAH